MRSNQIGTLLMLSMAVLCAPAVAQDGPPGDGPPPPRQDGDRPGRGDRERGGEEGRGGEGRRNYDPQRMQQMMMERLREQMDVPDDEWALLQPKIQRVATAQREVRAGIMMGRGWRGGPGGPGGPGGGSGGGGGDEPQTEMAKASRDLRAAVRNDNASDPDIKAKLAAYRVAHEKATAELATAREELKGLVSVHQEAVLVLAGLLE